MHMLRISKVSSTSTYRDIIAKNKDYLKKKSFRLNYQKSDIYFGTT
jgi:hypothetical protein